MNAAPALSATRGVVVVQVATMTRWFVFTPTHDRQVRAGFIPGSWYFCPAGDLGTRPKSCPYPTREAAIEAVNASLGD